MSVKFGFESGKLNMLSIIINTAITVSVGVGGYIVGKHFDITSLLYYMAVGAASMMFNVEADIKRRAA